MTAVKPIPDPCALSTEGDDPVGVWVALCPDYGWDHAAVYNDPMALVNCPHCWHFWGDERPCEIRHYDRTPEPPPYVPVSETEMVLTMLESKVYHRNGNCPALTRSNRYHAPRSVPLSEATGSDPYRGCRQPCKLCAKASR